MSNSLRILLLNHNRAAEFVGGDSVQIEATAKGLRRRGHTVHVAFSNQPDTTDVDVIHIFNARTDHALAGQLAAARQAGLPVVVSPIWISLNQARWGSMATHAVLEQLQENPSRGEQLLKQLITRTLAVNCDGELIQFALAGESTTARMMRIARLLEGIDVLLPNSWLELAALRRDLAWHGTEVAIAPYGVDPRQFSDPDPEPFRQLSGLRGPFVLQAGRVEAAKNPAMLLYALRDTNLPVVLAGRNDLDPSYTNLCKKIGGDRLHLHGHMSPDMLASAYAAAAVHALPSWCETCGLVTLEAAMTGTPVVVSIAGHESEYVGSNGWYCDPANPVSIKKAVEEAMKAGKKSDRSRELQQQTFSRFNWNAMVEASERAYEIALGTRRR